MKTLFRLDHYRNNFGTFAGFYSVNDEIPFNLIPLTVDRVSGNFMQVTEFQCSQELFGFLAWECGRIVDIHYFEEAQQ